MNSAVWRLRKLLASAPEYNEGHSLRTVGPETILERMPWLDVDTWALKLHRRLSAVRRRIWDHPE